MKVHPRRQPKYRLHRSSGRAVVALDGKEIYLGRYGTRESRERYERLIGTWLQNGRRLPEKRASITIAELCAAFWLHARDYYRNADGTEAGEAGNFRLAMRPLRRLYGHSQAHEFSPRCLKLVRERMISAGWARTHLNRQVDRIKHLFRWGVAEELVPPDVYQALRAVAGLRAGRSEARESEPVRPVPNAVIEATIPHLSSVVAAMVRIQLLTGARPGEICQMRTGDIDRSADVWIYRPRCHKTGHHGHDRVIFLGPQAQAIVKPFLRMDPEQHIFSPAESESELRTRKSAGRETPLSCGNRPGGRPPRRVFNDRFDRTSYARAIQYACQQAFDMPAESKRRPSDHPKPEDTPDVVEQKRKLKETKAQQRREWYRQHVWSPNQLRHNAATNLRAIYGIDLAQTVLGHRLGSRMTEIYSEANRDKARRAMVEVG